jgi:EmrB/QacA subfamily drug resistance transporter
MGSQSQPRSGIVLAVLAVAAFLASLDMFIVNVALPEIGAAFDGAPLSDLSWVLNGYAVLYAALLIPLGRLSDRYGRKAGFMLGLGLFTAASVACAASNGLWALVLSRAFQAAGAAALTPASLGLLVAATPPERRVRAVRIWAASGAVAAALGPAVGGVLVQASWRWAFLINIPVGLVALAIAARVVPDSRDTSVTRLPDLIGAGVITVAIGSLALALVKGPAWGWGSGGVLGGFAVAVAGLAAFIWRSGRHPSPVLEPALLRVRSFVWSNLTAAAFSVGFATALLTVVLWTQGVWGYSALRAGLAVAPGPMMVPVFAAVAQRVAHRVPAGWIAAAGCALLAAGTALVLARMGASPSYAADLLPGWLIGGIGVGLALPTILASATADLPRVHAATGSAVVIMSRQLGTVLGVSLLVAILGQPIGYAETHAAFQHVWWATVAVLLLAAAAALRMTPGSRLTPATDTPATGTPATDVPATGAPATGVPVVAPVAVAAEPDR